MSWPTFERKTVYVSCSADMRADVEVVRNVVAELNRRLPEGERWLFHHWTNSDADFSARTTWQENIHRASDPLVRVVICLFGEKAGFPLPRIFPFPPELPLPDWVSFPGVRDASPERVPLTGTLFELLDATALGSPEAKVLCYFRTGAAEFADPSLDGPARNYGFRHLFLELSGGRHVIADRARRAEYDSQIERLERLRTEFFVREGRPVYFFGSETATPAECRVALAQRLRAQLEPLFRVEPRGQRMLKGPAPYEPEDHDLLFGRDLTIHRVLERLKRLSGQNDRGAVLVLRGRSGEGKSSILRAGLVGRIRAGIYADYGAFVPVLTISGELGMTAPLAGLVASLETALGKRFWDGRHALEDFPRQAQVTKLVEEARVRLENAGSSDRRRFFLGLDQLEELLVGAPLAAVTQVLEAVFALARADLAWVVAALPSQHAHLFTRFAPPGADFATEVVERPGPEDLRAIIGRSLEAAGLPLPSAEVEEYVCQAEGWLDRQAEPGPVLPLLSALLSELVRAAQEAQRLAPPGSESGAAPSKPRLSLDGVLDRLGEAAWDRVLRQHPTDAEPALRRLLRQLVRTSFEDGKHKAILAHCRDDHPAIRQAPWLVTALREGRLLFNPQPDTWRLVHISIVENWQRAAEWYQADLAHQKTLVRLQQQSDAWIEDRRSTRLTSEPPDLDALEDLWGDWLDDADRLPIGYMRAALMNAFDPTRSTGWRRRDGGSRLTAALDVDDEDLVAAYLAQVRRLAPEEASRLVRHQGPFTGSTALHHAAWRGNVRLLAALPELGAAIDATDHYGRTALHWAAYRGRLDSVRELIEQGASVDCADQIAATSLMVAASNGHLDVVDELLSRRASVDLRDANGYTALLAASANGYPAVVRRLMEGGAQLETTSDHGSTALILAAAGGHLEVVRELIARKAAVFAEDNAGWTPLLAAARSGNLACAQELLREQDGRDTPTSTGKTGLIAAASGGALDVVRLFLAGAPRVDHADCDGVTALIGAAWNGQTEVVRDLLKLRPSLDAQAAGGWTALRLAVGLGHTDIVEELVTAGALALEPNDASGANLLTSAAEHGHAGVVRVLCPHVFDIDAPASKGWAALVSASFQGWLPVVRALLENGANVQLASGAERLTPLLAASARGHADVVRELLAVGADPYARDYGGRTPLILAAANGHLTVIRALLDRGPILSHFDDAGWSAVNLAALDGRRDVLLALMEAGASTDSFRGCGMVPMVAGAEGGHEAVVRALLDLGADVDQRDGGGWSGLGPQPTRLPQTTALLMAAARGHLDLVRLLLERGADVDARDGGGQTAVMLALGGRHHTVTHLLLEHRPDLEVQNRDGWTALTIAASIGDDEALEALLLAGAAVEGLNGVGQTALMKAAASGHGSIVRRLLTAGARVESEDDLRWTALLHAASGGHADAARVLLAAQRGEDRPTSTGDTAMLMAARAGQVAVVRVLLDDGVSVHYRHAGGNTATTAASFAGHFPVVTMLLDAGAEFEDALVPAIATGQISLVGNLVSRAPSFGPYAHTGWTALTAAANHGRVDILSLLLEAGAPIDSQDSHGETALGVAARSGRADLVEALLAKGARVDGRGAGGMTPLMLAAEHGHLAISLELLGHGASAIAEDDHGRRPISMAIQSAHESIVNALLARGGDGPSSKGVTPLHVAAFFGQSEIARSLIARGAAIDCANADGEAPLLFAAGFGHASVVDLLAEAGADLDQPNLAGTTPLLMALLRGHLDIARRLLALGADPERTTREGMTALMAAAWVGATDLVQELIRRGGQPRSRTVEGHTALVVAAAGGHLAALTILHAHGADVDAPSGKGETALMAAAEEGHLPAVKFLIEAGAKLDLVSHTGRTALVEAAEHGQRDVVRVLLAAGASMAPMGEEARERLLHATASDDEALRRFFAAILPPLPPETES